MQATNSQIVITSAQVKFQFVSPEVANLLQRGLPEAVNMELPLYQEL